MQIELDKIVVRNNVTDSRFETQIGEYTAVIDYYREDNDIIFTHTGVPRALEGHGIGSRLARTALNYARSEKLTVVPKCPFVRAYIRRHPEYKELVSEHFEM